MTEAAQLSDRQSRILSTENTGARHEHIRPGFARDCGRVWVNPSIHFDMKIKSKFSAKLSRSLYLAHHCLHETLPAETGIDGHHQQQIDLVKEWRHLFEGSRRADRQPACRPCRADTFQRPADIIIGLDVDGDIAYVRNESGKEMIGPLDHQVRIQRDGGDFCDRLHNGDSERKIVDKMAIHHVEVQPICAGLFDSFALCSEIIKITCEHRGRDDYRFAVHRFFLLFNRYDGRFAGFFERYLFYGRSFATSKESQITG